MNCINDQFWNDQQARNQDLLADSKYLGRIISSEVLPFQISISETQVLSEDEIATVQALGIEAARNAIRSLASLATIGELDHLGGGLDLIPAAVLTLAVSDFGKIVYTVEHAHTSIGHYSALSVFGYLSPEDVIEKFRRSIEIPGHVSWVPGGTQLNGGRLGVMIPAAVGQALGKQASYGQGVWSITHCGDAGWISGQALNGFNAAAVHRAPITFVMHRNGIQLSGATATIMDQDPRKIIESFGLEIIELESLHDTAKLYQAYRHAYQLAQKGQPSLIYPTGSKSNAQSKVDLTVLGDRYGVTAEVKEFAATHAVSMDTEIWIPGALMSYGDTQSMLECVFLVNGLAGGAGHHDGHMKGRDVDAVLANPMLQMTEAQGRALVAVRQKSPRTVVTEARPAPGTTNLLLPTDVVDKVELPKAGTSTSARAGSEAGYAAVAETYPRKVFVVSCDLDASTKLAKARKFLRPEQQFEMSIEEQASAIMANGLAVSMDGQPQLTVFSTFAAFFEGIAREGFEMWRYQRNLNGANEGLNVTFHLSHVGACTGRDHFSGWGLDWVTLALGYLPYLHRFYAPADARAAFLAVRDLAAHYGGHIIGIPRDNLPVLAKQDSDEPLWDNGDTWEAITPFRSYPGAKKAILALGAPAYLTDEATRILNKDGQATDALIINGLPLPNQAMIDLFQTYSGGIVTIEDGIIGSRSTGLRGFASLVATVPEAKRVPMAHIGIVDPRIAPSEGHIPTWDHFGITVDAIVDAVKSI